MRILTVAKSPTLFMNAVHSHSCYEIILNLTGNGTMTVGGSSFAFEAGTLVVVPPDVLHGKTSTDGFTDLYFQVDSTVLPEEILCVPIPDDEENSLGALLAMLHQKYYKKEPNWHNVTERLLDAVEELLLSRTSADRLNETVSRMIDRMIDNFTDPAFTAQTVIVKSGYHADYIRRLFRRQTGKTPTEYLTGLRITHAKLLLSNRELLHESVAGIAVKSGFSDAAYFSRLFRKAEGVSPLEYAVAVKKRGSGEDQE